MTINLKKGEGINLSKREPGLRKVRVGLGWDIRSSSQSAHDYDLDASVFVCRLNAAGDPKLLNDQYFIFYNNRQSPDAAVLHSGDNRTGAGDGDDETIVVDLQKLPAEAVEISFIVTIHEGAARGQNFGQVSNAHLRLYDDLSGRVVAEYRLDSTFASETAVQFGSLLRQQGDWSFRAVGAGYRLELGDFVAGYQE